MPYVGIPRDLNAVKTKLVFNLTKRQLICFGAAAVMGVPAYIFTRGAIGNSAAALLMIGLMLPLFFLAMYEKDGQPAEKILRNYFRARFFFPGTRPYKTENLYDYIEKEGKAFATGKNEKAGPAGKTAERRGAGSKKR